MYSDHNLSSHGLIVFRLFCAIFEAFFEIIKRHFWLSRRRASERKVGPGVHLKNQPMQTQWKKFQPIKSQEIFRWTAGLRPGVH